MESCQATTWKWSRTKFVPRATVSPTKVAPTPLFETNWIISATRVRIAPVTSTDPKVVALKAITDQFTDVCDGSQQVADSLENSANGFCNCHHHISYTQEDIQ